MLRLPFNLIFFPLLALSAPPPQEIIISADRVSTLGLSQSTSSNTIITDEEIRAKQHRNVYEVLREVPGVDVVSSGVGQTATILIRGAKSEQTLILIDGIEYNDPTDPGRSADLGVLPLDNINRIEVIRGAQSVLYPGVGSVINIITKSGKESKSDIRVEGGSFGTFKTEGALRGQDRNQIDYSLSLGHNRSDGISASSTGTERDGTNSTYFTAKLANAFGENTKVGLVTRYFDTKSDLDQVPSDTTDFKSSQKNLLARAFINHKFEFWQPSLALSIRSIDRHSLNFGSVPNMRFFAEGDIERVDFLNQLMLTGPHLFTFGVLFEREHAKTSANYGAGTITSDKTSTLSTALAQYELKTWSGFGATIGARGDYHSGYYFRPTLRAAPYFQIQETGTTLRLAFGNGNKAPSLYQLFGEYGNSSLKAEKSLSMDFGVDQFYLEKHGFVSVTAFANRLEDLVDFDFTSNRYINIGRVETKGIEVSNALLLFENLRHSLSYTFLEATDVASNQQLPRRPRHRISQTLTVRLRPLEFTLTHNVVGERVEVDAATFARKTAPAYHLFHLSTEYLVNSSVTIHGRIENVFDTKYSPIDGYSGIPLSFYVGAKCAF